MASNLAVESPNFDRIRKEAGHNTEDAIRSLWYVANAMIDTERRDIQAATDAITGKVTTSSVTSNQDNIDTQGCLTLMFTGAVNFNLTGIRNGAQGRFLILANQGAATITAKHESASSDVLNRIDLAAGVDKSIGSLKTLLLQYLNSRWRELSLA